MIYVSAGIIWNDNASQILITQRGEAQTFPQFWEFPGGKIEEGETPLEALVRELYEELGIMVLPDACNHFMTCHGPSSGKSSVELIVFSVHQFAGSPKPVAGQENMTWVEPSKLPLYDFPPTNHPVVSKLSDIYTRDPS